MLKVSASVKRSGGIVAVICIPLPIPGLRQVFFIDYLYQYYSPVVEHVELIHSGGSGDT